MKIQIALLVHTYTYVHFFPVYLTFGLINTCSTKQYNLSLESTVIAQYKHTNAHASDLHNKDDVSSACFGEGLMFELGIWVEYSRGERGVVWYSPAPCTRTKWGQRYNIVGCTGGGRPNPGAATVLQCGHELPCRRHRHENRLSKPRPSWESAGRQSSEAPPGQEAVKEDSRSSVVETIA